MRKREKAPGGAATPTEATNGKPDGTFPIFNSIIEDRPRQGQIAAFLMAGEHNAISAADLVKLAGCRDDRALRRAIDREREHGALILASEDGYYTPAPGNTGIVELRRFLRRQDLRAASNRRTTRLIRARLRELEKAPLDGQITFEEWG